MSQENVELVRRGIASADTFWALLDEDVVLDTRNYPGLDIYGTPVVVGRKAVQATARLRLLSRRAHQRSAHGRGSPGNGGGRP